MKTFKEYLLEMSRAGKGDWKPDVDSIIDLSIRVLEKSYTFITELQIKNKSFDLYKLNSSSKIKEYYILGTFVKVEENNEPVVRFDIVLECELKNYSELKDTKIIESIFVNESERGKGIATTLYSYFVKDLNYIIIGDKVQYYGARLLWKKLSEDQTVIVDLFNVKSNTIIETDIKLKHGLNDKEFDKRLWSYGEDKNHIRPLLRKILISKEEFSKEEL
jgi:predicted GNAT family acetyltransferase